MSSISVEHSKPQSHWWLVLIQGITAIILGVLLLTRPAGTIATLVLFLGIYWLISGVMTLVSLLWNREQWGLKLITGIIGIAAGLFIVQNPIVSAFVVPAAYAIVLGILGIVLGIAQIIQALRGGGWGIGVLGVMSAILGFLLVTNPLIGAVSLAWMLAILLIIGGILAIFAAFRLRGEQKAYEEAQAQASRAASAAGSTVAATASRATGAVGAAAGAAGSSATGAVGAAGAAVAGAAAAGAAAANRAGDGVAQSVSSAAGRAGDMVGDAVGSTATGEVGAAVAGAAAAGAAAANRAGDGVGQSVSSAAGRAGDMVGDAGHALQDAAGDVAGGAADLAAAGVDTVQDAGATVVEAVEYVFTGNVNPLDSEEMAKYKYPLEFIEGVGQVSADKLRAIGINNCLDLLKQGYHAKGRADIAAKSGLPGRNILTWVNHVDLYRIKGVGSEYADLLEASGVDTVVELAQRNPTNLFDKMIGLNAEKKLVRKTPTQSQVQDWVAQAKDLPRVITY